MGEVLPSCYGMSFTNVGKASPKKKKNWFESYQMETVKDGETSPVLFSGMFHLLI